ncbi:hypothetical protein EJ110_NYTH49333 [Nymphaea thermarum]|nr:hypothetical protein EJ110_NYTH49333 [Nymphaea thermarum]
MAMASGASIGSRSEVKAEEGGGEERSADRRAALLSSSLFPIDGPTEQREAFTPISLHSPSVAILHPPPVVGRRSSAVTAKHPLELLKVKREEGEGSGVEGINNMDRAQSVNRGLGDALKPLPPKCNKFKEAVSNKASHDEKVTPQSSTSPFKTWKAYFHEAELKKCLADREMSGFRVTGSVADISLHPEMEKLMEEVTRAFDGYLNILDIPITQADQDAIPKIWMGPPSKETNLKRINTRKT